MKHKLYSILWGRAFKISASSLFLSITVSLIISVILSAFFLLTFYQHQLITDNLKVKKLTHNMNEGIGFALSNYDQFEYDKMYAVDLYDKQDDSILLLKQHWGWYDRLQLTTIEALDSLHKTILVGTANADKERVALYVADHSELININNDSYIKGCLWLPLKSYKTKDGIGVPIMPLMNAFKSELSLPEIRSDKIEFISSILKKLKGDKIDLVSFLNNHYQAEITDYSNRQVSLNASVSNIVFSDKQIILSQTTNLTNVIIYAPSVLIQAGFKGNVQVFCSDSIIVEDDCVLTYPSSLTLCKQSSDSRKLVSIGQGCRIAGAIICLDNSHGFEKCYLKIASNTQINGMIYCMGMLQSQAKVYGSIMTTNITDGTQFNDAGTLWIDASATPNIYGNPILLKSDKLYEFIK